MKSIRSICCTADVYPAWRQNKNIGWECTKCGFKSEDYQECENGICKKIIEQNKQIKV